MQDAKLFFGQTGEQFLAKWVNDLWPNGRSGWPLALNMEREIALDQAFDYVESVEKRDIQKVDGVDRDPVRVHRLLRSLARNQGSQASFSTIKADLMVNESDSLSEDTISSYHKALKEIFVVEDSEALNLCKNLMLI